MTRVHHGERIRRNQSRAYAEYEARRQSRINGVTDRAEACAATDEIHVPRTEQPKEPSTPTWPTLHKDALHGLAGEVVNTISPQSEADPVAILIQFLVSAGNLFDRHYYYQVESDQHHANLFVALVGESAKARKGISWGRIKSVARIADEQWFSDRTKGGLSSGEGFIYEVRDPVKKWNSGTKDHEVVDPGVTDKRLTVIEPEFAAALAVMERHGNTLSPLIRKAWDGDKLCTLTKTSPLTATNPHVSIIGHITEIELNPGFLRSKPTSKQN